MEYGEGPVLDRKELLGHGVNDLVVVRRPEGFDDKRLRPLIDQLINIKFLPIILNPSDRDPAGFPFSEERFFPTDKFRSVGKFIITNDQERLHEIINSVKDQTNNRKILLKGQILKVGDSFRGGDFLYVPQHGIFMYSIRGILRTRSRPPPSNKEDFQTLGTLKNNGFPNIIDVMQSGQRLRTTDEDLDYFVSLFPGSDNRVHALVAEEFFKEFVEETQNKAPGFVYHRIPSNEVHKSGCNIADLRNGSLYILPSVHDAPRVHESFRANIMRGVQVIEAPQGFHEHHSGLRCAITSVPITTRRIFFWPA